MVYEEKEVLRNCLGTTESTLVTTTVSYRGTEYQIKPKLKLLCHSSVQSNK